MVLVFGATDVVVTCCVDGMVNVVASEANVRVVATGVEEADIETDDDA